MVPLSIVKSGMFKLLWEVRSRRSWPMHLEDIGCDEDRTKIFWDYVQELNAWRKRDERRIVREIATATEWMGPWAVVCRKRYLEDHGMTGAAHKDPESKRMIDFAREVDIREVAEVRGNKFRCIYHEDRHPSVWVKNGFGYCFPCARKVDAIAYTMETKGMGFMAAVRHLYDRND